MPLLVAQTSNKLELVFLERASYWLLFSSNELSNVIAQKTDASVTN